MRVSGTPERGWTCEHSRRSCSETITVRNERRLCADHHARRIRDPFHLRAGSRIAHITQAAWKVMRRAQPAPTIGAKQAMMLETDRPVALRQAILACRSGGTISVAGGAGGFIDKFPMGAIVNRALTIKSGQTRVRRYMRPLLERIEAGQIDPSFVITHRLRLEDAPKGYDTFLHKEEECMKVVLSPNS